LRGRNVTEYLESSDVKYCGLPPGVTRMHCQLNAIEAAPHSGKVKKKASGVLEDARWSAAFPFHPAN
jgi:hypothetical protein